MNCKIQDTAEEFAMIEKRATLHYVLLFLALVLKYDTSRSVNS